MTARIRYQTRLEELERQIGALDAREGTISFTRIGVVAIAAIIAWLALGRDLVSPSWVLVPAVAFVVLIVLHERLKRRRTLVQRAEKFYRRGIARIEGDWAGKGATGERFRSTDHLYADDLDLFGRGSLFELLSIAQTRGGEERLAAWLKAPAEGAEVRARQQSIAELRDRVDLRETIAVATDELREATDEPASLLEWAEAPPAVFSPLERAAASLLAAAAVGALVFWISTGSIAILALVGIAELSFALRLRSRIRATTGDIGAHQNELRALLAVAEIFAAEEFSDARLRQLTGGVLAPAASSLRRLLRLLDFLDAMRNQLFMLVGALLLWTEHVSFALAGWKRAHGREMRAWRSAIGELEALLSLANHAYEHPDDVLPAIIDGPPAIVADGIAHPLIPETRAVRNDVVLGSGEQLWIVSGSNMSGKSTLLRTVGVNCVLAFAGGVVRARSLTLTPLQIGASIRINDSLQEGNSRFYAEVLRIRNIVERAAEGPLLFLLDEIFNGTNSHDRRIGAEAIIRTLLSRAAVGMVTTHDLALAQLAESLAPRARNVHFEDHIEHGRMVFDYTIKEGVVTKSNALELMRAVGLDV